jgi:hypothetical protein
VQAPPGDSLQPEAIGAVMEVTKWLKPSDGALRAGTMIFTHAPRSRARLGTNAFDK